MTVAVVRVERGWQLPISEFIAIGRRVVSVVAPAGGGEPAIWDDTTPSYTIERMEDAP